MDERHLPCGRPRAQGFDGCRVDCVSEFLLNLRLVDRGVGCRVDDQVRPDFVEPLAHLFRFGKIKILPCCQCEIAHGFKLFAEGGPGLARRARDEDPGQFEASYAGSLAVTWCRSGAAASFTERVGWPMPQSILRSGSSQRTLSSLERS